MTASQTFAWTASGTETDLEAKELDVGPQLGCESLAQAKSEAKTDAKAKSKTKAKAKSKSHSHKEKKESHHDKHGMMSNCCCCGHKKPAP